MAKVIPTTFTPLLNFVDLLMKGTLATGNVREVKFAYYKELTATHCYDNRDVFCLSTKFSDSLTSVRRRVANEVKDIPYPDIIDDYNKHMHYKKDHH